MAENENVPVLHVRYAGRSDDIPLGDLDIGAASPDREVHKRLAIRLNIQVGALRDYIVDRHANGNMTVRPEAVFG